MIRILDRLPPSGLVDQRPARTPFAYLVRLVIERRPELLDRDWTVLDETIFAHVTLVQPDTGIVLKDWDSTCLVVDGDVELETYVGSCYADS